MLSPTRSADQKVCCVCKYTDQRRLRKVKKGSNVPVGSLCSQVTFSPCVHPTQNNEMFNDSMQSVRKNTMEKRQFNGIVYPKM